MKQYVLFEKDHLALVKELWEKVPVFGPGDKVLIADNGGEQVIIDKIVEECGTMIYEAHSDSVFPINYYLTPEEVFSNAQSEKCRETWEKMESKFHKIFPGTIGIEESVSYDIALVRPWRGKRVGSADFALLSNGLIYVKPFGEAAYAYQCQVPEQEFERVVKTFEEWQTSHKGMYAKREKFPFISLYQLNDQFVSWDGIREMTDMRKLRKESRVG